MRLVSDASPRELIEFLRSTKFPFDWPEDVLARCCHLTRIDTSCGSVAGYVWFQDIPTTPVVEMHIAFHPQYHGKVVTRRLLVDLYRYVRARLGALSVLARPISEHDARLLVRLGFQILGPFAILPISNMSKSAAGYIPRVVDER